METKAVRVEEVEKEEYIEVRDRAHKCSNCGFIVIGGSIPGVCPGCGGKKVKFVLVTKRLWKCSVCGYIHEGNLPPDLCPVCGAGGEEFYEVEI